MRLARNRASDTYPGMYTALSLNEKRNRRMEQKHYIIRGGEEGRARLRVLSRVMRPTTLSLLDRAGIRPGMECLEVGCGSGDLAFDLSQMVGAGGRVVATDIDEIKLRLARQEAEQQRLTNLEFRLADIVEDEFEKFDFAHARFVLTHLRNPQEALEKMWRAIRPGGILVLQDSDFRGVSAIPNARRSHATCSYTHRRHSGGLWIQTLGRGCPDFSQKQDSRRFR